MKERNNWKVLIGLLLGLIILGASLLWAFKPFKRKIIEVIDISFYNIDKISFYEWSPPSFNIEKGNPNNKNNYTYLWVGSIPGNWKRIINILETNKAVWKYVQAKGWKLVSPINLFWAKSVEWDGRHHWLGAKITWGWEI